MKNLILAILFCALPILTFSQSEQYEHHKSKIELDKYYIHIVVDTAKHEVIVREFIQGRHEIVIDHGDSTTVTDKIRFAKKYVFHYKNDVAFTIKGKNTELVYIINRPWSY